MSPFYFRVVDFRSAVCRRAGGTALTVLLLLALAPFWSVPARADVVKIVLDGTIHPVADEYVGRALEHARSSHADALLIELSTPGGLLSSTEHIVEKILASPVPVIVYVAPSGTRAASAGFFLLESADVAAMAPSTRSGASHPVAAFGGDIPATMKEKIENDAAAMMRSLVSKHGRDVALAETAVRQSKSFTDEEALKGHLIDYVARDEQDLFHQIDSHPVKRADGSEIHTHLSGQPVRYYPMTLKQEILAPLMDPNVALVILVIGLLAIYFEFNHPGMVAPGVVGAIMVVVAIFALNLLPTRFAALGLILLSFVLFALEAKFTSHGALTLGGIATMIVGALLLVDAPIPEMRVHVLTALAISVPVGLITSFLVSIAWQARRNKVVTGSQGLLQQIGVARTALNPAGRIFLRGELWNAIASSDVAPGEQVRVQRIDGLTLYVDPVRRPAG